MCLKTKNRSYPICNAADNSDGATYKTGRKGQMDLTVTFE